MNYIYPNKQILEKRSSELGNAERYYSLSKMIFERDFKEKLLFPLGIDNEKEKYYINLIDKSGLFISGETGSGKSIFLNDIVISLLLKNSPEELQLVFVDPRNVEFNNYCEIPQVKNKVFSDAESCVKELMSLLNIIEERKILFSNVGSKNIIDYNETQENKIPHIVVIIDESADLVEYKASKDYIRRILLDGYKFGIHIILATSSYLKNSFDPETINMFSYVLSFDLASEEQAKYIQIKKANLLSVYGEALVKLDDDSIVNIQVPYVSDHDIEEVVNTIKNTNKG